MKNIKKSLITFLVIVIVFSAGIIAAVLTVWSKSVWPAAFLHAAHNAFDQAVFGVITGGDNKMYYVSETGFITIICAWIIAIVMACVYLKSKFRTSESPERS